MEDRLAELLKNGAQSPATAVSNNDELIPSFNKKSNSLQYYLNKVIENNKDIAKLKDKHASATLTEQERTISGDLDRLIQENTKLCLSIKQDIEFLESEVEKSKQEEPDEPETRIKDITFRALKGKFADVLKESQNTQIQYKTAVKTKIARQAKIIDPTLTPEQVEAVCNDPEGAGRLLENKMLGTGHMKLKNAVMDIQDKYKDIQKLERSVQIVHQMFVDLQIMVQAQGEMLDNIELNIQGAKDYMKKAVVSLDKAKKSHQIYRKYKCCLLITLLVIIGVAVIVPLALK
jgi:t-SNARE complex subunit (syntaxin)